MLLFALPNIQDSLYEVVSVDRKQTPAFRLGFQINDTLVVSRNGKKFEIHLSPQHTLCGAVKQFAQGDHVAITKKDLHDGDSISREAIRLSK